MCLVTLLLSASVVLIVIFALCYKVAAAKKCNLDMVNVWMYFGATLTTSIVALVEHRLPYSARAVNLGMLTGVAMFIATLSFFYHIRQGKLSASWTVVNLSVAFPVLAGLLVWHEHPSIRQIVGLLLIAGSLLLFGRKAAMEGGEPK